MNKQSAAFIMMYDAICLGVRIYNLAQKDVLLRNGDGTFVTQVGVNGHLDCPDLGKLNRIVAPNPAFSVERHEIRQFARVFISTGDPHINPNIKLDVCLLPYTYGFIHTVLKPCDRVCELHGHECDVQMFRPGSRDSMLTARHLVSTHTHKRIKQAWV